MTEQVDHASSRTHKRGLRKKVMIGAALAGMASIAGLTFAEWLATGTGSGYARSTTAQALTTEFAMAGESLYPGGLGDLVLRIHNPNQFPVTVTSVGSNGAITSDDPACDAAGHGVTFAGVTGLNLVVGAGTSETFTLPFVLAMASTASSECQGDLFTVPVSLNGGTGGGGLSTWFADADADGWGDQINSLQAASQPLGYVGNGGDCDDTDGNTHPGATEVLGNGIDDDCDGMFDDDDPGGVGGATWYSDLDGDAYGDPNTTAVAFSAPPGYVSDGSDCDDSDQHINPGETEVIDDGIDNDCDGFVDDEASVPFWYPDVDGDGWGTFIGGVRATEQPDGYVSAFDDCDDTNNIVYPHAEELIDLLDNNCNGIVDDGSGPMWYGDADLDTFAGFEFQIQAGQQPPGYYATVTDCDDENSNIHPGAVDLIGNGIDEDCDFADG